jgi:MerR family transcriptional regulator, light-induced transcriptional regulator
MMNASSDSASRLFAAEFANLSAVVHKRLELECHYHQRPDLEPGVHHLFQYAMEFGRLLQVVYRHQLFDSLREEAQWYAAVFAARGAGYDSFAVVLESWIIAIQGLIKPPECNELAQPLQSLRDGLHSLIDPARDRRQTAMPTPTLLLVENLVRGDVRGAREIIASMAQEQPSPDRLIVEAVLPAMAEIGQRWESNEVEIFQEHLATEAFRSLLAGLPAMIQGARPKTGRTALVSCVPGDEHELIPLALATYLEIRGWMVKNLGGSLPASQIARAVAAFAPDTLFLTFTMLSRLDDALEVIERIHREPGHCRVVCGGRGAVAAGAILAARGVLVARDFDDGYLLACRDPHDA